MSEINIEELTIKQAREISAMLPTTKQRSDFRSLIGEYVMIMCLNYNYYGKIDGTNDGFVYLSNAHIVYETGSWSNAAWEDAQRLPNGKANIAIGMIESWFVSQAGMS